METPINNKQRHFQYHLWKQIDPTPTKDGIHCSTIVGNTVWAGCQDGTIGIWHIRTGELVGVRQAHRAKIFAMHLVGDYVWTASQDNKVKRWTTFAVYYDEVVLQETSGLSSMVCTGDEMWCGSTCGLVQVFDVNTKASKALINTNNVDPIRCLFFEGERIWVCQANEILRYNKKDRQVVDTIVGSRINAIVKPTDTTVWAASSDSTITVYDLESGQVIQKLLGHKDFVFTLMVFGDCVWSGGWDCKIRIWDAYDFSLIKVLDGHKQPLNTINVIPIQLTVQVDNIPINDNKPNPMSTELLETKK
jgi:WD40 repeat protein